MTVRAAYGAVILLLASGSGAMAQTAQQFDLVCEGRKQDGIDAAWQPYSYGFRVDLDAGLWCWRETCDRTYPVVEATPDRLVFTSRQTDDRRERSWATSEVSRRTGKHEQWSAQTRPIARSYKVEGDCRPAEFGGFPASMF